MEAKEQLHFTWKHRPETNRCAPNDMVYIRKCGRLKGQVIYFKDVTEVHVYSHRMESFQINLPPVHTGVAKKLVEVLLETMIKWSQAKFNATKTGMILHWVEDAEQARKEKVSNLQFGCPGRSHIRIATLRITDHVEIVLKRHLVRKDFCWIIEGSVRNLMFLRDIASIVYSVYRSEVK